MVVSQIGGPQYRPPNTVVFIMGTPKEVPPCLGNPHRVGGQATSRFLAEFFQGPPLDLTERKVL